MQAAVGADDRAGIDVAAALEVGDPTAGLLDQDRRRSRVPRLEAHLDHRLGGALGDEGVPPEVAEPAVAPTGAQQVVEPRRQPRLKDVAARAVQQLGIRQARDGRDADLPWVDAAIVGPRATATVCPPALPE